jgi:phosphate transport system substrate-binding protein
MQGTRGKPYWLLSARKPCVARRLCTRFFRLARELSRADPVCARKLGLASLWPGACIRGCSSMPSRRRRVCWLLLTGAACCGGCGRRSGEHLTLAGSTSVQSVAEKWASAYEQRRPAVAVTVQGGGSTAGVRAASSGAAQIGLSSRALTSDEASRLRSVVVARDGIALIVHPTNPVNGLARQQVARIYAGTMQNWSRAGGRDLRVTAITREEGSGTRAAFESLVMAKSPIAMSTLVQDSTGAVRQMVSNDPAAIGYISIGLVDHSVKALRLDGEAPTEAAIDAGLYPLVRPFLFLLPQAKSQQSADFVAWVTGPEGRALARSEGLLPPSEVSSHALR